MSELERRPRFSASTLGVGVAIGLALAFVVNLLVAAIIGFAKMAIIGTLVLVVAWLVLVGPPERKR